MEERVAALSEGLRAERPWRNVQRVLLATFAELAEILELQTRRLAAAEVRAERLERRQSELEQRADKQKEEEAKERRKTLAKWRSEDERRARKQVAQIAGERNEELVSQWGKDVAKFVNQAVRNCCGTGPLLRTVNPAVRILVDERSLAVSLSRDGAKTRWHAPVRRN